MVTMSGRDCRVGAKEGWGRKRRGVDLELRAYQSVRLEQSSVTCLKNSGPEFWCPYEEFRRISGVGEGVRREWGMQKKGNVEVDGWGRERQNALQTSGLWGKKGSLSNPHSLGTLP